MNLYDVSLQNNIAYTNRLSKLATFTDKLIDKLEFY